MIYNVMTQHDFNEVILRDRFVSRKSASLPWSGNHTEESDDNNRGKQHQWSEFCVNKVYIKSWDCYFLSDIEYINRSSFEKSAVDLGVFEVTLNFYSDKGEKDMYVTDWLKKLTLNPIFYTF